MSLFQPGIDGETPYVTTDYSFDLSGAGKLRFFKGLTRASHAGTHWTFLRVVVRFLAFSFHGWCLLVHQVPPTVYFNVQQVPQSSFTQEPWKISGQSEGSQIWPLSDVARSRRLCGILTHLGVWAIPSCVCPQTAERFSTSWTCRLTSPPHISTLKIPSSFCMKVALQYLYFFHINSSPGTPVLFQGLSGCHRDHGECERPQQEASCCSFPSRRSRLLLFWQYVWCALWSISVFSVSWTSNVRILLTSCLAALSLFVVLRSFNWRWKILT